jgi:hypothetical protein
MKQLGAFLFACGVVVLGSGCRPPGHPVRQRPLSFLAGRHGAVVRASDSASASRGPRSGGPPSTALALVNR